MSGPAPVGAAGQDGADPAMSSSRPARSALRERLALGACLLAVTWQCHAHRWTCDDAFISFRYAENLALGRGLVFNAGERVEGYTNFLWTVGIAPAFALGVSPETWTQVLGAASFAATVWILGALHFAFARRANLAPFVVPFACLAAAAHREWAIFAVSGLETAAFTLCEVGAFAALVWPSGARWTTRGAFAGTLLGLGVLVRPDGVVFGAAAAVWLALDGAVAYRRGATRDELRGRARALAAFVALFGAVVGAHLLFRLRYYGDLFPNTYYAKSASAAWYGQGVRYLWAYLLRYPPLALLPLALLWLATRPSSSPVRRSLLRAATLAALLAAAHVSWVVRVGGDFMFGRFLVPATPFVLFVLEAALFSEAEERRGPTLLLGAATIASFVFLPMPIASGLLDSGIADEHAFYSAERVAVIDERAARVKPILEGLGARVAFYSAQARFVHRAAIPTAVESETGLTDAFVARQVLSVRRRVGHEKKAPPGYLIDMRHVHLASVEHVVAFDAYIPYVPADLHGVRMQVLHWDPDFVRSLRQRGAAVADYPAMLDATIASLDTMTRERAQHEYDRARHFYFAFVVDPTRERAFLDRLGRD